MAFSPAVNLKGFILSRPPLMIFVMCLGFFAIILMTLGYYVKLTKVADPDESEDWNVFLESFSDLNFCILDNNTDVITTTTSPAKNSKDSTTAKIDRSTANYETLRNYSVKMLLTVRPTKEFSNIPHNLTRLSGAVQAKDLDFFGVNNVDEMINIMMDLPIEWPNNKCSGDRCDDIQILGCVNLQGPSAVFPETKSPAVCEGVNDTGVEYNARLHVERSQTISPKLNCASRPLITLRHKLDPSLTLWLSLNDRSVVNLHLLHTSYFLFVMVVTLLCYAIIRGHNGYTTTHAPDKVLLHS